METFFSSEYYSTQRIVVLLGTTYCITKCFTYLLTCLANTLNLEGPVVYLPRMYISLFCHGCQGTLKPISTWCCLAICALKTFKRLNGLTCAMLTGGRDGAKERWDGSDGVGGEHPILVDGFQRSSTKPGTWRPGLAAAAEQGITSPWLHVHYFLRHNPISALVQADFVRFVIDGTSPECL